MWNCQFICHIWILLNPSNWAREPVHMSQLWMAPIFTILSTRQITPAFAGYTHLLLLLYFLTFNQSCIFCVDLQEYPSDSDGKASDCDAGDLGLILGSGRSPGEGNGNPLQYSCLENPMDGGAQQAIVHGVAKSQT